MTMSLLHDSMHYVVYIIRSGDDPCPIITSIHPRAFLQIMALHDIGLPYTVQRYPVLHLPGDFSDRFENALATVDVFGLSVKLALILEGET